jgi:hypothetical protein
MRLLIIACLLTPASAMADSPCLPKAIKAKSDPTKLDLGIASGTPIVCAGDACWDVDLKTGALTARAGKTPPGHSSDAKVDAKGCADGYCTGQKPTEEDPDYTAFVVTSTDGAHVAVVPRTQKDQILTVFDARTKKLTKTIRLMDDKAPGNTSVGNIVADVFYVGNTIYIAGADAGPYEAVWAFKDDGTRVGLLGDAGDDTGGFSIYQGSVNIADDSHVILTDGWAEHALVVSTKDNAKKTIARAVKRAPCGGNDFLPDAQPKGKCARHLAKAFEPYEEMKLVTLADGTFLAAFSGNASGDLAILDPSNLTEKKRLHLKVCAK